MSQFFCTVYTALVKWLITYVTNYSTKKISCQQKNWIVRYFFILYIMLVHYSKCKYTYAMKR